MSGKCSRCGTQLDYLGRFCLLCDLPSPPSPVRLLAESASHPPPPPPVSAKSASYQPEPGPREEKHQSDTIVRAGLMRRTVAILIDWLVAALPLAILWGTQQEERLLYSGLVWLGLYWLFRDSVGGCSLGKLLAGIRVVIAATDRAAGPGRSLIRNGAPLLLMVIMRQPLRSIIAFLIEPVLILVNKGRRLGDLAAGTRVIFKNHPYDKK